MSAIPLYELSGIEHAWGGAGRPALRLERLVLAPGEALGLTGPNGSGKSTLLRILAFLTAPDRGEVRFDGTPVADEARRAALRREVTLLLQEPRLLRRKVFDNVAYGLRVRGERRGLADRVAGALTRVGLAPERFARRWWYELSGGEAQRVALAARLVLRPRVLLLDEPTASLDAASAVRIMDAIHEEQSSRGVALVVASHDRAWLDRLGARRLELSGEWGGAGAPEA
ncbi:MAG: ATP-binding cassette domain-containing protein [Desulfovibrionaceae bacterium]